jgi:hypothetical protein
MMRGKRHRRVDRGKLYLGQAQQMTGLAARRRTRPARASPLAHQQRCQLRVGILKRHQALLETGISATLTSFSQSHRQRPDLGGGDAGVGRRQISDTVPWRRFTRSVNGGGKLPAVRIRCHCCG